MTSNTLLESSPSVQTLDPFRPPDWRWNRANEILTNQDDSQVCEDPTIQAAVACLAGQLQGEQTTQIQAAIKLRNLDTPERWEIEARILAGESNDEIASQTGRDPEVIACFESLFFHVRADRNRIDYLLLHVIGTGPQRGFRDEELREFWCWVALSGGPVALEYVIEQFQYAKRSRGPIRLSDYFRARSPAPIELQAFVAGFMLPTSEKSACFDFQMGMELQNAEDLKANQVAKERLQRRYVKAVRNFLAGKPLVHRPDKSKVPESEVRPPRQTRLRSIGANCPDV